jgi:hypothetical protein
MTIDYGRSRAIRRKIVRDCQVLVQILDCHPLLSSNFLPFPALLGVASFTALAVLESVQKLPPRQSASGSLQLYLTPRAFRPKRSCQGERLGR